MDKEIEKHKTFGRIACWKFKENLKNYPGWNICFDAIGRESIIALLDKMDWSEWPSKKSINITDPLEIKQEWILNNGKIFIPKSIIIKNKKEPRDLWSLKVIDDKLIISIGSEKLTELKNNIKKEIFDEAMVGNESENNNLLYFW